MLGSFLLITVISMILGIVSLGLSFYGLIQCFKKHILIGVASLIIPGLALVVGLCKLFKYDILKLKE